jgi:hypothetical protein
MRYSLKSLLFLTALVAVVCGVFVLPRGLPVLILPPMALILLGGTAAGSVYASNDMRAFCIGYTMAGCWIVLYAAIFPFLAMVDGPRGFERLIEQLMGSDASAYEPLWGWKIVFAGYLLVNVLGGLAAIAVRRACLRRSSRSAADRAP